MNEMIRELELTREQGSAWLRESLGDGFGISETVLASNPFSRGRFLTLVSSEIADEDIRFPHAPDVPAVAVQEHLAQYLDEWRKDGASCFLFEDDVRERGDTVLERWNILSAFIGTRVVHWVDLGVGGGKSAVESVNTGAFGYPLNAFVLSSSPEELELADKEPVPEASLGKVAESLMGVVVSAFDATSYVIWDGR